MGKIINKILFIYIISIYIFDYKPLYTNISNLLVLIFICLSIFQMLVNKKEIKLNEFLISYLIFIFIALLSYFYALNKSIALIKVKTISQIYVLVFILINYLDNYKKIRKIMNYFIYSGVITSIYLLFNSNVGRNVRIGEILGNENTMGIIISISFIFCFYSILFEKKYIYIFPSIFMLVTILLTGSRTAFGFFMIGNSILLWFRYKNIISLKRKIQIMILGILITILICYLVFSVPIFYNSLGKRIINVFSFFNGDVVRENSIKDRTYMIKLGIKLFKEKPILGYGMDNYKVCFKKVTGIRQRYAHNNYIELLVDVGIIGTLSYYFMYFIVWFGIYRRRKILGDLYYLFSSFIISILAINFATVVYDTKYINIIFAIISSSIVLCNKIIIKKKKKLKLD